MPTIYFTDAELTALPSFELFGDPKPEQPRDRFYRLTPETDLADGQHPQIACPPEWVCTGIEHYYGQHLAHFLPATNATVITLLREEMAKLPSLDDSNRNVRYHNVASINEYPDEPPAYEFELPPGWRYDRIMRGPRHWQAIFVRPDGPNRYY